MFMAFRVWLIGFLVLTTLAALPLPALGQEPRGLHDMAYTSPNWGYHVRWHSDEWTIDEETSEGGADSLWLSDTSGNVAGFDGAAAYNGDATLCLDDLIATVESIPDATNIEVVYDEAGTEQSTYDPRRSWIMLLVGIPAGDQVIDHVVYLDCRTLAPGQAVLARTLAGPAATFLSNLGRFSVVQTTLPRSAWEYNAEYDWLVDGRGEGSDLALFFDGVCGGFPRDGRLLFSPDGTERAMVSLVDGTSSYDADDSSADNDRVLMIENTSTAPLTIDPAGFVYREGFPGFDELRDIGLPDVVWEDTGDTGAREIGPGSWAPVQLLWPDDLVLPQGGVYLLYRDDEFAGGEVEVDSIGVAGGCGGGSRPNLRISR
jgi:hypothetical protein